MDETIRKVAWSIAEAWWRKKNRVAAGSVPEATSSTDYADNFWQSWADEGRAAVASMNRLAADRVASEAAGLSAAVARF